MYLSPINTYVGSARGAWNLRNSLSQGCEVHSHAEGKPRNTEWTSPWEYEWTWICRNEWTLNLMLFILRFDVFCLDWVGLRTTLMDLTCFSSVFSRLGLVSATDRSEAKSRISAPGRGWRRQSHHSFTVLGGLAAHRNQAFKHSFAACYTMDLANEIQLIKTKDWCQADVHSCRLWCIILLKFLGLRHSFLHKSGL